MTEDEAKIIASQFLRSLMRGETPSGPQGPLPRSVRWIDSDPEWQQKFQEAYRAGSDYNQHLTGDVPELSYLLGDRAENKGIPLHGQGGFEMARSGDNPWVDPQYMQPAYDKIEYTKNPSFTYETREKQNDPLIVDTDYSRKAAIDKVGSPLDRADMVKNDLNPLSRVFRTNPVELAKNLASRVNAGPMNPWDLWPGGLDGYLRYLGQHGVGMGQFIGADDAEGEPA